MNASMNRTIIDREEELVLVKKAAKGDQRALDRLVKANRGYVMKWAFHYRRKANNVHVSELVSAGDMGLMIAIRKFDPSLGFRIGTYAQSWIRQMMARLLYDRYVVRRPERKLVKGLLVKDCSLDVPVTDDTSLTFCDLLKDTDPSPEEKILNGEVSSLNKQLIIRLLKKLTPRERLIILGRIVKERTLQDISVEIGVSRERVRQIEVIALNKLRKAATPHKSLEMVSA